MQMQVKLGHAAMFCPPGKSKPEDIGKLVSFTDSDAFGNLPKEILFQEFQKAPEGPELARVTSFLLGFDPAKEKNTELNKLHDWLKANSKGVHIIFDKYQSVGLLLPAQYDDLQQLQSMHYKKGFVCKVVKNKNPGAPQKTVSFDSSADGPKLSDGLYRNSSSAPVHPSAGVTLATLGAITASTSLSNPTSGGVPLGSTLQAPTVQSLNSQTNANPSLAEDHYNKLKREKETRHLSQLFHMRNLNNFVKAELIDEGLQLIANYYQRHHNQSSGCSVLELACGKGGDINKWMKNNIIPIRRYVGTDIAENSIREFVERLMKRMDPTALQERICIEKLFVGNLNEHSLTSSKLLTHTWKQQGRSSEWQTTIPLQPSDQFDLITCQFAMHYMFRSLQTVDHFFTEISQHLADHGYYLATTIDYRIFIHYFMKAKYGPKESAMTNKMANTTTKASTNVVTNYDSINGFRCQEVQRDGQEYYLLQFYNEFQKLLLQIEMTKENVDRLLHGHRHQSSHHEPADEEEGDWFGLEYNFILHDNDKEAAVNSPEFLVPFATRSFQQILSNQQLALYRVANFHEFIAEKFQQVSSRDR